MTQLRELSIDDIKMGFVASCIESAAQSAGCSYQEMFARMEKVDLINGYILKHYDTIHTESRENATADVLNCLTNWETSTN